MPRIVFVTHDGVTQTVEEADGVSVMQAALNADITGIVGECGGSMMCATCHVYVREPWAANASGHDRHGKRDAYDDGLGEEAVEPVVMPNQDERGNRRNHGRPAGEAGLGAL